MKAYYILQFSGDYNISTYTLALDENWVLRQLNLSSRFSNSFFFVFPDICQSLLMLKVLGKRNIIDLLYSFTFN